jgi:hypothetical protein
MDIIIPIFVQAKDLLKIGFTKSIHTCRETATAIRKKEGKKRITSIDVANHLYLDQAVVLRMLNK